ASGWNVFEGTLRLNKAAGVQAFAAGGTLTVGDNIGGADADRLALAGVEQIPDAQAVAVNSTGVVLTAAGAVVGDKQQITIPTANTGSFTVTVPGIGAASVPIPF